MRVSIHRFSQKMLGEAGLRGFTTLFVLLLARSLGAEDFGRFSSAMAYAAVCAIFVDLGTNSILVRDLARHPERRTQIAESSHFLKILAAFISWLILLALTLALGFPSEQRYLTLALGVLVAGQTLTEYFSSLLSGIEEMGWEAILKISSRVLVLAWASYSLIAREPLQAIVTHLAVGTVIGYVFSVWMIRSRLGHFGFRVDIPFLKSLMMSSLPAPKCPPVLR